MTDMTIGKPGGHLWRYAVPVLLANWMQLSYNAVDTMIAGRFLGKTALAAEGIAGPIMNLVILAITGSCIGAGVLMSEAYGAKAFSRLGKILANTLRFGGALCLILAGLGLILAPWLLRLLAVPEEIMDITTLYLRITFLGAPFTFFYNALATALKSVGDAKTPLKFLAFSAVLNAVLDFIFLGFLGFGILCSAATTVFAEAVSAMLAMWYLTRKAPELLPRKGDWAANLPLLKEILRYAAPSALQQAVQPVGKVLIQSQVNALGVTAIAAFNAVTRMDDFACIPEQGISSAISTFVAQNRGAKKFERLRTGFTAGLRLEFGYWILIGTITALFRQPIVTLFISGEGAQEVISQGSSYLSWMALFYLWPAMTNGFQGFFRGMGRLYTTILGTTIQISVRTLCVFWLVPRVGLTGIAFASALGWTMMLLVEIPYYFRICRKQEIR